jgi:hypothetical protein
MFGRIGKYVPILLGVLLLYSGAYKALLPGEATYALVSLGLRGWLAQGTIILVTAVELYLGVILLGKIDLKDGLSAATLLMFVFTAFLWYLSTLANPPACGCLGMKWAFDSGKQGAILGIARNCIILWLLKISHDYYFGSGPERSANSAASSTCPAA